MDMNLTCDDIDVRHSLNRQISRLCVSLHFLLQLLFPSRRSTQSVQPDVIEPPSFHLFHAANNNNRNPVTGILPMNKSLEVDAEHAVPANRRLPHYNNKPPPAPHPP